MPPLNNIPRKHTVCPTCPKRNKVDGSRLQHPANGFEGTSYASPFTAGAFTNAPQHNTATQVQLPATQVEQAGQVVPLHQRVRLHPEGTHILAHQRPHHVTKRVMGPSPSSNTPFHPQPSSPRPRPITRPGVTTEKFRTAAAVTTSALLPKKPDAAGTPVHVVGSFLHVSNQTLVGHSNLDLQADRWQTVKRGAAG
jgi:hypothetical protein